MRRAPGRLLAACGDSDQPASTSTPALGVVTLSRPGRMGGIDYDDEPHIALILDDRPSNPKPHKPRRWVVERALAWLSK